ncbi:MAG: citrate/2-methylcitrate synthase [Rhizobiaceae bacterium]
MKKADDPIFLSAREAAAELAISPATLYAYVSRGMVRSEPLPDSRERRYHADDIRALKDRRLPGGRSGDAGVPVLDTAICTLTERGPVYRGALAIKLADQATLEQTATLLWDASGSDPFALGNLPALSEPMARILDLLAEEGGIARAVAVLALASDADPRAFNRSEQRRWEIGARVMRLTAAAILGTKPSAAPLHEQVANAWAPGDKRARDWLRLALVLMADHELNASTYTARCAASTGLNLYDATIAGLVALKGPKHGGAGPQAAHLVAGLAEGDLAAKVRERVALGDRIPGFGHTVYKDGDPRAEALLATLIKGGASPRLAKDAPVLIAEAIGLRPNADFALAVMMRELGLPLGHEILLFAIARTAGWVAHAIEQLESGVLIRPRARYVGAMPGRGG